MTKRRPEKLPRAVSKSPCNFSLRGVVLAFMNTILVTGATGNVGHPLVNELAAAGVEVRAVTRRPDTARFPDGVTAVRSAAEGLRGATAVFLNSRALGDQLEPLVRQARHEGVTRLVALSAINVDDDFSRQPSRFRGDRNKEVEQLAVASGLEWVSLRPTVFITNFFGMWAPQIRAGEVVNGPYATASTAPIVDRDISAVAAKALLTDELVGRKVPMTGPQAFTNSEMVQIIGAVLGRSLRYQEVPGEFVRQRFTGIGFSAEFADAYLEFVQATVDKPALVTNEVEKILGRPAGTFAEGVAAHRHLFTN
jgi:uncharacterized protein YbjT (DUF2867 family)